MSGWAPADKFMEENTYGDFPAVNNATVTGYLPSDQVPAPSKSSQIFLTYISPFKVTSRGPHEEPKTLQKVLSIRSFHCELVWHAQIHFTREGKASIGPLLETELSSTRY